MPVGRVSAGRVATDPQVEPRSGGVEARRSATPSGLATLVELVGGGVLGNLDLAVQFLEVGKPCSALCSVFTMSG